jgi:hypothetical protein
MKPIKTIALFAISSIVVSCSAIVNPANGVNDDVYAKRKESQSKPKTIDDIEPWNKKKKGPQANLEPSNTNSEASENSNYSNSRIATSAAVSQNAYDPNEAARAAEASRLWAQRQNMVTAIDSPVYESNLVYDQEREEDRETRRMGTSRSRFYNDPYYDVLSQNWGWTSFYNPVTVFPGYYGFAPGFNVGLGWNNRFGWNTGFGFNTGWGNMGWGNPGWGWNDPFYNPWNPYANFGWGYNPYWDPYFGYGWGYNPWNPYYGYGWGGWGHNPWRNNWGWRRGCFNNRWGNDIVLNRPFMRPMNGIGSSLPGGASRPAVPLPGGRSQRPAVPNPAVNQQGPDRPQQTARPTYNPNRPQAPQPESPRPAYTNKPGGDLIYDNQGRPTYVPPRRDRNINASEAPRQSAPTYNGTGEVRPSYGSPAPSRPSNRNAESRPSAPSAAPSRSNTPSQPMPSRPSTPSYSRPAPSAPAPSRPAASPSPSRPSGGSGAAPSGGSFRRP